MKASTEAVIRKMITAMQQSVEASLRAGELVELADIPKVQKFITDADKALSKILTNENRLDSETGGNGGIPFPNSLGDDKGKKETTKKTA